MAKGSHIVMEYKHRGEIFTYIVARYGQTKNWAAQGHLESDPSVEFRTVPFPTKEAAATEFIKKAKKSSLIESPHDPEIPDQILELARRLREMED